MKVAGPWVMVLGWPVVLLTWPTRCDEASVMMPVVTLSVRVCVGDGRWSTRVDVMTRVVRLALTPMTDPESRCKRV